MRVLLISHFPLIQSESGSHAHRIASALETAGHAPRMLVAADPAYSLPWFSAPPGGLAFSDLSDAQINSYREAMRRRLDVEVAEFNPQVIHVQHVWLSGQLALESGVPYVLTAWEAELDAAAADRRFQPLADQAAENASRILAVDRVVEQRLRDRYEGLADRIEYVPPTVVESGAGFDLVGLYELILRERFGR